MRVKTAAVGYSRKFNLGDYESVEISCNLWAEVNEDEPEEGVVDYLFQICKEKIKAQIPPNYKRANPVTEISSYKFGQKNQP